MALRKKTYFWGILRLDRIPSTYDFDQYIEGIGTIYTMTNHGYRGHHWVLVQANQDVDSVYVEAYWDVAEAPLAWWYDSTEMEFR